VQFLQNSINKLGVTIQLGVLILTILSVIFSAAGFMFVTENATTLPDAGIHNFVDALYYITVTLSTVGYGDISPR
jgi:voltage-gated potassium channel